MSAPPPSDAGDDGAPDRVAEVMHQALAEQVAEQRAVSTLLAEVRERLALLDLTAGAAALEALAALAGLPAATEELGDGLAGLRTDLRQVPEQVGGAVAGRVAEPLEGLRVTVRDLAEQVEDLALTVAPLTPGVTGLEEQLAGVAARVVAAASGPSGAALTPLIAEVAGLRADLDALRRLVLEDPDGPDPDIAARLAAGAVRPVLDELMSLQADRAAAREATLEARIRRHVDDAVLALAEVVLSERTRPVPAGPAAAGEVDDGGGMPSPVADPGRPPYIAQPVPPAAASSPGQEPAGARRWFGKG